MLHSGNKSVTRTYGPFQKNEYCSYANKRLARVKNVGLNKGPGGGQVVKCVYNWSNIHSTMQTYSIYYAEKNTFMSSYDNILHWVMLNAKQQHCNLSYATLWPLLTKWDCQHCRQWTRPSKQQRKPLLAQFSPTWLPIRERNTCTVYCINA